MKTALGVLACALLMSVGTVQAQVVAEPWVGGVSAPLVAPAPPLTLDSGSGNVFYYSYYMAPSQPARVYVGYGANDYPFYGSPYGSPSDRWSWEAMSNHPYSALDRYYYPPVR